jgi:hypothetical protein
MFELCSIGLLCIGNNSLNKIAYVNMYIKARLTNCPNYEIFGEY